MASFKKRKNGSYQATIYVGRDANGKQLFKYVTRSTLKECKAAARKIEQEIEEGKLISIENIRVAVWIEQYFEMNKNHYAPSTRATHQSYLKNHFEPYFGNLKLKQLNEIHIKKFKDQLLGKMLPSSAKRIMGVLSKALKEGMKDKSPARDVPLPKENKSRAKAPSTEEFMQIHKATMGGPYEPLVLLAGWCGFRRGEIFALKPDDLDFKQGTIRIDESYSINDEGKWELGPPKSENGYRTEVAPKYLMDLIRKRLAEHPVINERIWPYNPSSFSSNFSRFIRKNNLPQYRFHDLRHYHATWLYDQGIPDLYAARRMGQTLEVLKKIYQHLRPERGKEIEAKILQIENLPDKKQEARQS